MSEHHAGHGGSNPDVRFEASDAATRPLLKSIVWLTAVSVGTVLLLRFVFVSLDASERKTWPKAPAMTFAPDRKPPGPVLLTNEPAALEAFRQSEDAVLNSYGWVDAEKGRVRIPVEEAIHVLAGMGGEMVQAPAEAPAVPAKAHP